MTPEVVNSYFTPLHYVLYLGGLFVMMVTYYQWKWAKICNKNIQVLVAQLGGGGTFSLAPKEGGEVTIKNPYNDSVRTWPVNELATIDVLYPGVGFVPAFLQKTIRMAIVNEGDWEPMLNRSPHREKIASPDVVEYLMELAEDAKDEKTKAKIVKMAGSLSTGPTREMIANPAVLGDLMRSSVMKALATVSNDLIDILKSVNAKLGKVSGANPMVVYIGLGLIVVLLAYMIFQVIPAMEGLGETIDDIAKIKAALGIL